jgi:hypothetical protein
MEETVNPASVGLLSWHTLGTFSERVHHSHGGLVLGKGGEKCSGERGAESWWEGNVGKASREGNPNWGIEEGEKGQRHLNTV